MKKVLNKHFVVGVVVGVLLLAFFPQLNPRTALGRPKKG